MPDSAAFVIDHAFSQIFCPHFRDLQPAKCDTCRQPRSCLRSGKIAVDWGEGGRSGVTRQTFERWIVGRFSFCPSPPLFATCLLVCQVCMFSCICCPLLQFHGSCSGSCPCSGSASNSRCVSSRITAAAAPGKDVAFSKEEGGCRPVSLLILVF